MDVRYLSSLIAVIESGSIAEAARGEFLTAAAVGQRIQSLERELGVALLSRTTHTARPTEACLAILPRARHLVREATLLRDDAGMGELSGTLRIGAISTALTGVLPGALRALTKAAPLARPVIVPGTSRDLYQALHTAQLDAAIIVAPPFALPQTLRGQTLRREPLVCLSNKQSRQSTQALLRTQPYIRYDPNAWGGRHASRFLADHGIEPAVMCDLDALETIGLLVGGRMGVSLVPRWLGIERFTDDCRVIALAGAAYARQIVLVSHASPTRPRLLAILAQALRAHEHDAGEPAAGSGL